MIAKIFFLMKIIHRIGIRRGLFSRTSRAARDLIAVCGAITPETAIKQSRRSVKAAFRALPALFEGPPRRRATLPDVGGMYTRTDYRNALQINIDS
jgi:hypothetical protein